MTSQSPRIYIYKITFEEVLYYYYGVHKEEKYNEYYMGSPITHKWMWDFYTPKKQILQLFDFTDEGWLEAQEIEKRIIKPVYNVDKWCLNENCGGIISLEVLRKNGKILGLKHKENGTGFCGRTPEQMSEDGKKGGLKIKEIGVGIFALTPEQRSENARKSGLKNKENGTGVCGISIEQRRKIGRKSGIKAKETGLGIFAMTPEERSQHSMSIGLKNKENGTGFFSRTKKQHSQDSKKGGKNASLQRWECLETGFVTNAGNLSRYQMRRGIDTSKRKRIL